MSIFSPESERSGAEILKEQFAQVGFDGSAVLPRYVCGVPGEGKRRGKGSLLLPVVKYSEEFLAEHGYWGRYDSRSSNPRILEYGIQPPEQDNALSLDQLVFRTEYFDFRAHFDICWGSGLAPRFNQTAECLDPKDVVSAEKFDEIQKMIKNSADRIGLDLSLISPERWVSIIEHAESLILASIDLPDWKFHMISGLWTAPSIPYGAVTPLDVMESIFNHVDIREEEEGFTPASFLQIIER